MMGLANRIVPPGKSVTAAVELAKSLSEFPQKCMRSDRQSSYEQWSLPVSEALQRETQLGIEVIASGETQAGAARFTAGEGRHGGGV